MSAQVPVVVTSCSTKKSVRHTADFRPSSWGNYFLTHTSDSKIMNTATQEQHTALKEEVREMISATAEKHSEKLILIDTIQRLGVAYHFEKEIQQELEKIYHHLHLDNHDIDLHTVSLNFRLLRQQGIKISCDVFKKFKDDEGKFKASLINDVQGMLSFYEAAYLAVNGEDILDEAITFTITHLKLMVSHVSSNLAEQINHTLYRPLRKALPRLEARYFLDIYPRDKSHNRTLLKFAKLDFNVLQAAHQKEISSIIQWWKYLDFPTKLPYARNRIMELYFWIHGVYFEPKYALGREIMTKVIYITSIIDDTFDAYGTFEELKLFTDAIKRWDIEAIDTLPEYMKLLYKTLLDIYNDIEEELVKQQRSCGLLYAKEKMQELVEMYFIEAKWLNKDYVPTIEEYMEVALISGGYLMLATTSFLGMGDIATKETFEWISSNPKIIKASSVICRLMDDIVSHKFEQKRGHVASAVECYIKQHGGSEEDAIKVFQNKVAKAWKDMNEELLEPTAFPMPLLERVLNFARVIDNLYKEDDCYTNCELIKDQIASLFKDPVPL